MSTERLSILKQTCSFELQVYVWLFREHQAFKSYSFISLVVSWYLFSYATPFHDSNELDRKSQTQCPGLLQFAQDYLAEMVAIVHEPEKKSYQLTVFVKAERWNDWLKIRLILDISLCKKSSSWNHCFSGVIKWKHLPEMG